MIHKLSQDLINKIAAGEVVERPVSIVKELTENAVDAAATRVLVKLEQGGTRLIQVIDDGSGMDQADAQLSLVRHATSKLSSLKDLFQIQTLGFRGEALASIAAVSQFSLLTKTPDSLQGYQVWLDEAHQVQLQPQAANSGTTVTVQNLFYNVPARQKFLKTAQTEYRHILHYLQQFALVHSDLELLLEHNEKQVFHYRPMVFEQRCEEVLGADLQSKLIGLRAEAQGMTLSGCVAKPELVHATHKNQYLFVNKRPVYNGLIARTMLEAYETLVPRGYFPAFVLKIDIDPELVDVNAHPRKSEVRLLNPSPLLSLLKTAVRRVLSQTDLTQEKFFSQGQRMTAELHSAVAGRKFSSASSSSSRPLSGQVKQALGFSQAFPGGIEPVRQSALEEKGWRIIGQIHRSFILVETPDGLQMLDQHAVSEITNYARLMRERENGEISSQGMLLPARVEVTHEEASLIGAHHDLFARLGWELDQLSDASYQISAIPEILQVESIETHLHEILSSLKEERGLDMHDRELAVLKYEACRGAVMFGDCLTMEEMHGLLNQWLLVPNHAACEHGRPAAARISTQEMLRFFKR